MLGYFAWLPLVFAEAPPPPNATSCSDLLWIAPEARCNIRFSEYRAPDPRLARLEKSSVSGLFDGAVYRVRDAKELNRLSGSLRPGDRVLLSGTVWRDQVIDLRATGSLEHPILLAPEDPDLILTGASRAVLRGDHIIVQSLTFRDELVDAKDFVVLRLGAGTKAGQRCDSCIAFGVTIANVNSAPEHWDSDKIIYLQIAGVDNTIANSQFLDKENNGVLVAAEAFVAQGDDCQTLDGDKACRQRLHFIGNRVNGFSLKWTHPDDGRYKIMQLGESSVQTRSAFSIIENNTFEHAVGGNEVLSIKAADVIIRKNTFRADRGVLNLRAASRTLVENNQFLGDGQDSCGGVRIEGGEHWIVNNRFEGLVQPMNSDYRAISVRAGNELNVIDRSDTYAQAHDVVIARNVFNHNEPPYILLGTTQTPDRPLMPRNFFILDNKSDTPNFIQFIGDRARYENINIR